MCSSSRFWDDVSRWKEMHVLAGIGEVGMNMLICLLLLLLHLLNHIAHESASKQYRRLIELVVLVTQCTYTAGLQDQTRVIRNVLVYPPAREGSQDVTMSDYQHVVWLLNRALGLTNCMCMKSFPDVRYESIAARCYVCW